MNNTDILIIDDLPNNLRLLSKILEGQGYQVRKATNGKVAIQMLEATAPDLILLDIMMPDMDGYQVARYLKQSSQLQNIPIIFLSALNDTMDKVMAFKVGGVDYITKPFQVKEVLARVQTQLTICQQQRQLEEQNQRLQQEIQERKKVEAALRVYIHAVSHDLRNPVAGIVMVLNHILEQEMNVDVAEIPISRAILERMASSCDRQLNLINSLVETSDTSLQNIQLACEAINLYELIHKIKAEWLPICYKNQVKLQDDVSPFLPKVKIDPNQIWRVYDNLISNAMKYNQPGITIMLSAELITLQSNLKSIQCMVKDDGIGIEPQKVEGLFELYQRGEKVGRVKGFGLGLYLCRQIIEAHGGTIGIQSQSQPGAGFCFTLPLSESE